MRVNGNQRGIVSNQGSNPYKTRKPLFYWGFHWKLVVAHDLHFQTLFICKYYSQERPLTKVSKVHFGVHLLGCAKYIIIER